VLSTAVDTSKTSPKSLSKKAREHKYQHEIELDNYVAAAGVDFANINQKKILQTSGCEYA
jgi:hypothetical protein